LQNSGWQDFDTWSRIRGIFSAADAVHDVAGLVRDGDNS